MKRGIVLPVFFGVAFDLAGFTPIKGKKPMDSLNKNRLLNRKEAANYLGIKEITLAIWQSSKRYNIPVVKVGRLAKYRYGDLLEFVARRTVNKPADLANGNKDLF